MNYKKRRRKKMNNAKKRYALKCKTRTVTFYPNENELYEFSKTLNFQQTVKKMLKRKFRARNGGDIHGNSKSKNR